jgi:hypothetical protein
MGNPARGGSGVRAIESILPETGMGTMRSMVEGGRHECRAPWRAPSVTAAPCHLAVPGRS